MNTENYLFGLAQHGVNVRDRDLKRIVTQYANDAHRLLNALSALIEATARNSVRHPNAFIKSAILGEWEAKNPQYRF